MATKNEGIEVRKLNIGTFDFTIVGDTPLILHAWDEKAKRQMLEKQGFTTIGKGVTVQPAAGRQTFYMGTGAVLTINSGAKVLDDTGAEIAPPLTAANIDLKTTVGESDADWLGAGVPAAWTDNR